MIEFKNETVSSLEEKLKSLRAIGNMLSNTLVGYYNAGKGDTQEFLYVEKLYWHQVETICSYEAKLWLMNNNQFGAN